MHETLAGKLINPLLLFLKSLPTYLLLTDPYSRSTSVGDSRRQVYQYQPDIAQHWGQYSPWFSVPSTIPLEIPPQCTVTFAQVLSRHGSRDPTIKKTRAYARTIQKIHQNAQSYGHGYEFIKDYIYDLGADQLTLFGQLELINSGADFFQRYHHLASDTIPFVRASGQGRVVESAQNWTQGFHLVKSREEGADPEFPYHITVISEAEGSNNTLNHGLCDEFEAQKFSGAMSAAQQEWSAIFLPPIRARLNANLPGANLSAEDTVNMMDLCPYNTIASPQGFMSAFCDLFTVEQWRQYDYYQSLNKYYGHGAGHPLGPTQGVGFVNELIARLTNSSVVDHTSTNSTLDDNPSTFPLGHELYADFTHDNDMTGIYFALGLYSTMKPLSNTTIQNPEDAYGYSAAYTVPFAARLYVEKLSCTDAPAEEMVRIILNDRVMPMETCDGDELGRCRLSDFIKSLSFARHGGRWSQCFV